MFSVTVEMHRPPVILTKNVVKCFKSEGHVVDNAAVVGRGLVVHRPTLLKHNSL